MQILTRAVRRPRLIVLSLIAGTVLLTSACSSSGIGAVTSQSGTSASSSASTAPSAPALTGKPIVLGQINDNTTAPEVAAGSEAAVKYVNAHGGVDGRPLVLDQCATTGSSASSATCAEQLLQDNPVAFIGGNDDGSPGSYPIIEKASMPVIGGVAVTNDPLLYKNDYIFGLTNPSIWSAAAKFISTTLKAKTVAVVIPQAPGQSVVISGFIGSVLKANGAKLGKVVYVPTTSSDAMTPAMLSVLDSSPKPQGVLAITFGPDCLSALKEHAQVAPNVAMVEAGACTSSSLLQGAGSAANGVYFNNALLPVTDTSDTQVQTYNQIMSEYAPSGTQLDEFSSTGVNAVMNAWAVFKKLGSNGITASSINKAFHAARNVPNFMGATYSCDERLSYAPGVCNTSVRFSKAESGTVTPLSGWYDGTSEITIPAGSD